MSMMRSFLAKRGGLVVLVLISMVLGAALFANLRGDDRAYAVESGAAKANTAALAQIEGAFTDIADRLAPTVVSITSERQVEGSRSLFDEFFRDFPGFPRTMPSPRRDGEPESRTNRSNGSGVVVRSDGYIMTNDHVVGGADKVIVKLRNGREYTGTVLRDPYTDLALVKIDAKDLPAAQFADSDQVKVGQWAIAIGNPFGLEHTLTVGVVSALTREFAVPDPMNPDNSKYYPDAIQTDASINPGNSGGPLVDIEGRIIGINAAIKSPTGGNTGIGFAIPSNTAKKVMEELISEGKVTRGYLGLMPADLTPVQAEQFGVKEGAVVQSVDDDTPAGEAGIRAMDVITEFNGQKVKDALDLRRKAAAAKPGSTVKVKVHRDGKPLDLTVNMTERPEASSTGETDTRTDTDKIGLRVGNLTADILDRLKLKADTKGVIVQRVKSGSGAERSGIRINDVIVRVGRTDVKSVSDYNDAVKKLKSGETALVLVMTSGRTRIAEVTVD